MVQAGSRQYWNGIADLYQEETVISCFDFHYGPLLPGDIILQMLPTDITDLNCLELGCGAGQNSIFLASKGGKCTALDVSERQLLIGRQLAESQNVKVEFIQGSMEAVPIAEEAQFDLGACRAF